MSLAYSYPKSRFEPAVLVDLNSRSERERLSRSALLGFFKLAASWQLRDDDARELLGGLSSSSWYDWKKNPDRVLEVDRITRVSYLLGIYKALHILYGDKLADEWIHLPNTNQVFGGRTPLAYMLGGGLIAMQTVRKLLDARRGGL
ncbi:MbcA/ParS/Xre antitoxin family protein [Massilia sp. IC2-477]|uniref:MbcA/ParS/Xre antitoxin family protein n=1 Tax=unclassified Massilia TaxID=2609279 RepID=UPI001D10A086|nr:MULTISPECIES: MbcA/ParS/Xre antitoxin family protein [unclassified Massilia]MCC2955428.1 MbcA/ParS/Xre antitoxin family protein [Massilia sp. IC2-477]MCC2974545.1 MbcA/ParS/Xre antitoxin family protein [Massilia sp. IC2-476]